MPLNTKIYSLIVELHKDDEDESKFYVKWIYDDVPLMIQDFWDDEFRWDIDSFLNYLSRNMLPKGETFEEVCGNYKGYDNFNTYILIFAVAIIIISISVTSFLLVFYRSNRNGKNS